MKLFISSLFIYFLLLVYLILIIDSKEFLLPFCIIFNLFNVLIILIKPEKSFSTHNLSRTFNIIINLSTLMFMYPDLLASDPYINIYGESYYITKAFKLVILHQTIITLTLKLFEFKFIGDINLNQINFYNRNFLKTIIKLNISAIALYFLSGKNITNFISGRSSKLIGSYFKIEGYSGGYDSVFHILNYFIQFSVILSLVYLINIFLSKLTKSIFQITGDKIAIVDKYLLLFLTISYLISAFYSDIRINLIIIILPTLLLFFYLGKFFDKPKLSNRLITHNTSKLLLIIFLILSFLIISELQVYRRGNINFLEKKSYSFSKNTGIVQTDKSLYNLSQIIKLTPQYGTQEGKDMINNLPYNFVPSLIAPNKPGRVTLMKHQNVENSIFNNFNDLRTSTSISITFLGEFILAYGEKKGFLLSILSMISIAFLNIFILSKSKKSFLFPYIYITSISFSFLLCRSINHYTTQFVLFIYSTLFLFFLFFLRGNIKNRI